MVWDQTGKVIHWLVLKGVARTISTISGDVDFQRNLLEFHIDRSSCLILTRTSGFELEQAINSLSHDHNIGISYSLIHSDGIIRSRVVNGISQQVLMQDCSETL